MKYKNVEIGEIENPIIIIGQNPGNQRKDTFDGYCWHGNRSADLLLEAIGDHQNIVLTNACQYREVTADNAYEGMKDLTKLITDLQPTKLIVLGNEAKLIIEVIAGSKMFKPRIKKMMLPVYYLQHPSYIVRFNKDRDEYIKEIRGLL